MEKRIELPFTKEKVIGLKCGDKVLISGNIYTARDAAHKRFVELLDKGQELPINIKDEIIYYVGPTPAKPNEIIGSAGPTSSYRMDAYSPRMIQNGLRGMIGKGMIGENVIEAIKKHKAIYFAAIGGAGALISKCIEEAEVIAYDDLGAEAVRRLKVKDFPVIVAIDSLGKSIYNS